VDPQTQQRPVVGSVLLIDDSLGQLAQMKAALEDAGYDPVVGAADWTECRHALARFSPALVIVDVQLPGNVSGDIMVLQLKRHPACRGSKFLFHSGAKERDLEAMAARSGADGYVKKGDLATLVACVQTVSPPPPPVAAVRPWAR
jgi:DNA-binding response OmpR family regulator